VAWRHRPWRSWAVCLPALLALGVSGAFLMYSGLTSASNCKYGCSPVSEGLPIGIAGDVAVLISGVVLLIAGMTTPAWRRAVVPTLWMAVAIACGCAALIATAHPVSPVPSTCSAIGGRVLYTNSICFGVPYVDNSGQRDYGAVGIGIDGLLTGPADTTGTGATYAECESGRYPNGPSGPVTRQPGRWDAPLSLCLP
jgi:hypothetical protein